MADSYDVLPMIGPNYELRYCSQCGRAHEHIIRRTGHLIRNVNSYCRVIKRNRHQALVVGSPVLFMFQQCCQAYEHVRFSTNISTSVRTQHKTNIRTIYYEHFDLMQIRI